MKEDNKKSILTSKGDVLALKEEILKFRLDVEKRFYNNILWTIGSVLTGVGLLFTMIKVLLVK